MINTERLLLRMWKDTDLEPFAELNADERVCEFLPNILSKNESDALARRIHNHFETHGYGLYALEEKKSGNFIGFTGLNIPDFNAHFMPAVEIGWRLDHKYWGHGYATEAAEAVLDYGFNTLNLQEVVSFTVPENIRSRRVMEKIGMRQNDEDDFLHPKLPKGHPLKKHVLYRVNRI